MSLSRNRHKSNVLITIIAQCQKQNEFRTVASAPKQPDEWLEWWCNEKNMIERMQDERNEMQYL